MATMPQQVMAPPARPPIYGLIAAAPEWAGDGDIRELVGGWTFQPEGCGLSGRLPVECEGNTTDEMERGDRPAVVTGTPVWLYAGDECTAAGFAQRDFLGRARRQLAATESFELANELWTGTAVDSNRSLARLANQSDTLTAAAADPVDALGLVECGLASYLRGQQGMVHVTTQVLTHLMAATAVERAGTVWRTAMGNIVVADAGYDGSGPGAVAAGASQWIYGTPMLSVRLGAVITTPDTLDDARGMAQVLDRSINDIVVWAGRFAGVRWASECAHVAAQVDLATCAIGGAG